MDLNGFEWILMDLEWIFNGFEMDFNGFEWIWWIEWIWMDLMDFNGF